MYEARGVSADKRGVYRALEGTSRSIFAGAFCQAIPDILSNSPEHCLLMHADGAGTKSSLAYVYWRETGDISVFRGLAEDSVVMNLDDLLCVGATGPFALSNLIGRNAKKVPEEVVGEIVHGYNDFADRLAEFGIVIGPCGGETADLGDLVRTLVVDSVLTTRMRRENFINLDNVTPSLSIVGLAGFGQAAWEYRENSGIGTNGFTAARHELLGSQYGTIYPESFDPGIAGLAYTGRFELEDPLPGSDMTIGQALLSPTRTYAPVVRDCLAAVGPAIKGMVHNSGGGLTKSVHFGHGIRYVKTDLFTPPPIFMVMRREFQLSTEEMVRVFNMGQRYEILCEPSEAESICEISRSYGVEAKVIGYTEETECAAEVVIELFGERAEFRRDP